MRATKLLPYHGKPVFRFPVKVTFGQRAALTQQNVYPKGVVHVIAHTAAAAADLVQDEVRGIPCVEVEVFGPKGGVAAKRWQGFETAIGHQMFAARPAEVQTALFGDWLKRNSGLVTA